MSLIDKFLGSISLDPKSGCWEWYRCRNDGYAQISYWSKKYKKTIQEYAHRFSYKLFNGEIPEGFDIDHLCRNRKCANPSHLEAVTRKENLMRGIGFVATLAAAKKCKRGHEFTDDNIYYLKRNGIRQCIKCKNALSLQYFYRKKGIFKPVESYL